MTPERYARAAELFLAARKRPADERPAFLREACGDDDEILADVASLLEFHEDDSERRLGTGAVERDARGSDTAIRSAIDRAWNAEVPCPIRIGHYAIEGVFGIGGMGVVYRALQDQPRRTVALKVIRQELTSPAALRRFEYEAQALGRMQHPGIAQIFEAGMAEVHWPVAGGQWSVSAPMPFFAMEMIDGQPLTDYARAHGLTLRERLMLLASVCEAVHYAHTRGVIHRDLKPGNILVGDQAPRRGGQAPRPAARHGGQAVGRLRDEATKGLDPALSLQPKILDFGIARVLDADFQVTSVETDSGQIIGTLAYMSPEQISGDPHAVDARCDVYALGVIGYELLAGRPTYALKGKTLADAIEIIRNGSPAPLGACDRSLRGDLETMIAKAMEKDAARRYQSAAELAADIQRHLRHEPILARPASTMYHLRKFARRNRALVGGATIAVMALLSGTIGTSVGLLRANREASKAERIQGFLQGMLESIGPEEMGKDVRVREVLDLASTQIETELAGQPEVEAAVRHTIGNSYEALGLYEQAEPHLRQSMELFQVHAGPGHPDTLTAMHDLALLLERSGKWSKAEELLRSVVETRVRLLGEDDRATLNTMNALGWLLFSRGRIDEAEALLRRTLALQRQCPDTPHGEFRATINNLANVLIERRNLDEAEALVREALDSAQKAGMSRDEPPVIGFDHTLAGIVWKQGRVAEAEALFRDTLERRRRVLGPDHPTTLTNQGNLSTLLLEQKKLAEAEPLIRATLDSRIRKLGEDHAATLMAQNELAALASAQGDFQEAESLHRKTLEARRRVLGERHPDMLQSFNNVGVVVNKQGRTDEALALQRELCDMIRGDENLRDSQTHMYLGNYGSTLMKAGRFAEAETVLRDALRVAHESLPDDHADIGGMEHGLARCLMKLGRLEEAEPLLLHSLDVARRAFGEMSVQARNCAKSLEELQAMRAMATASQADSAGGQ